MPQHSPVSEKAMLAAIAMDWLRFFGAAAATMASA